MRKGERLSSEEAQSLLLRAGFEWVRSKGSHRIYRRGSERIVIPFKSLFEKVGISNRLELPLLAMNHRMVADARSWAGALVVTTSESNMRVPRGRARAGLCRMRRFR